jgi:hypothetical protein
LTPVLFHRSASLYLFFLDDARAIDPTQQCTHYYSPLVQSIVASYPPVWEIASIVQGDEEATNAYNAIINDPNFPNFPVKGTPQGDFSSVVYTADDPDCWYVVVSLLPANWSTS